MGALRLLVSDLDNTLLTRSHELPRRVIDAVEAAQKAGVLVVLATARSPVGARRAAETLGVPDLVICFNGGWIGNVTTGTALHKQPLNVPVALDVMAAARAANVNPMWYAADGVRVFDRNSSVEREAWITGDRLVEIDSMAELTQPPGKIMCVRDDADEPHGFNLIRKQYGAVLTVATSHSRLLEVGPPGVSKRTAAEWVAARLGVAQEDCAAAGDAANDMELLRWAAVAVAVENAVPEVKRLAGFVGPSCDEGGMADAVSWLLNVQPPEPGALSAEEQGGGDD